MNSKIDAQKKAGADFLEANKTKPGVVSLPEGIQYEVLKEGSGAQPTINDKIKAHYRGALLDGKEFDSSFKRNCHSTDERRKSLAFMDSVRPGLWR